MRKPLLPTIAFIISCLNATACSPEEKTEQAETQQVAADVESVCLQDDESCSDADESVGEEESATVEEVYDGPTCADQKIPSWDKTVQGLTDRLCERCHNNNFAWNGVLLNSYEEFVKNVEGSMERIETGNLSFEMRVIDKINFLDWYENGMPKSESDCRDFSQAGE